MREIQAADSRIHLPRLLDQVEHGETMVITRHGRPIVRLVPDVDRRREEIDQVIAAMGGRAGKLPFEERLAALDRPLADVAGTEGLTLIGDTRA